MRKTRRIVRRRKQKGKGLGTLAKAIAVIATAFVIASPLPADAKKVKKAARKLTESRSFTSELPTATTLDDLQGSIMPMFSLPDWKIPDWDTFSNAVLEATKAYENVDSKVSQSVSKAMFDLADEVESGKWTNFDPKEIDTTLFTDETKPEEKKEALVEGQTYTVSGTIPKDSSNIRPGDKVIFQKMSNDQYVVKRQSDNPEDAPEYFLSMTDVTLTPVTNQGGRKTRRKNVRRKK